MGLVLMSNHQTSISLICLVGICVVIAGFLLKKIHQPNLVAYIIIGIIIGDGGFQLIADKEMLTFIGELGIILLFFFLGMEINLDIFVKEWKLALFGTTGQILLSVASVYIIGSWFDWSFARILVIGFVIALSSSAVIFKILEEMDLYDTKIGQNVSSILLSQDIAIAPILIAITIIGGESLSFASIMLKIAGGVMIISIIAYIYVKKEIKWIPFKKSISQDHELQVFMAIFYCFAGALIAGLFGISEALGAFVGGLIMHASKATEWIHDAIHSFRILFVAIFFIAIGAQIDLTFISIHWIQITTVLCAVYLTNHLINACILRLYGNQWKAAIYGGALLAQIGELSFLIALTALQSGILSDYAYDFSICLISLTICISPLYILVCKRLLKL